MNDWEVVPVGTLARLDRAERRVRELERYLTAESLRARDAVERQEAAVQAARGCVKAGAD